MKIQNKKTFFLGTIIFLDYLSVLFIIIFLANTEKMGKFIVLLPWIFLLPIVLSIIAIIKSLYVKANNFDEKIEDLGPLGPKPQILYSASKGVLFVATLLLIFGIIGFLFFINLNNIF